MAITLPYLAVTCLLKLLKLTGPKSPVLHLLHSCVEPCVPTSASSDEKTSHSVYIYVLGHRCGRFCVFSIERCMRSSCHNSRRCTAERQSASSCALSVSPLLCIWSRKLRIRRAVPQCAKTCASWEPSPWETVSSTPRKRTAFQSPRFVGEFLVCSRTCTLYCNGCTWLVFSFRVYCRCAPKKIRVHSKSRMK